LRIRNTINDGGIPLSSIFQQIYRIARQIPYGRVTTYGQLARLLGSHVNARVVGYAMNGCRDSTVPCHRVVNRFGGLCNAFLPLGKETHRTLLEMEGVEFAPDGNVDMNRFMWYGPEE
jgi:methylated-DNA-protein-cysteine methyltransferase-like protein